MLFFNVVTYILKFPDKIDPCGYFHFDVKTY